MSFHMVARIETEADIQSMREAGRCASRVLEMIGEYVQPGVSTEALNER
jgi:methionyl aminopeptidase